MKQEFLDNMKKLPGLDFDAFVDALSGDVQKALRINTLKTDGSDVEFKEEKVPWARHGYYHSMEKIGKTWQNRLGLVYSQDASAMAPVEILDPKPGEKVLDLCAAPGGKSTQIAQLMQGHGLLVSNEIVPQRSRILYENIERLGVANAVVLNESPDKLEDRFEGYFDKILVDAPCSGEGMFRKDDTAADMWTAETNESCAVRQRLILKSAVKMLKPEGILVYSTCTFSPVENEYLIKEFLADHSEMTVEKIETDTLSDGIPPLTEAKRLYPHIHRGEGHFVVKLRKNCGAEGKTSFMQCEKKIPLYDELCKTSLNDEGFYKYTSGGKVFLHRERLPELKGLRWITAGIYAGDVLKGRFQPAHHLAIAMDMNNLKAKFELDDNGFEKYIRGETLSGDINGWCVMHYRGYAAGWGKGAGGIIKNHYPKGLRKMGK